MQICISAPKAIRGTVHLPSSKSISNRALIVNALAENPNLPDNVSDCDDTRVMLEWLSKRPDTIDIGAAGTAMRFSTALLAVTEGTHVITGTQRMCNRPIQVLVDALRSLGASIDYVGAEGFPPLRIEGTKSLLGGSLSLAGNVSSQYISALLMIAPVLAQGLTLHLKGNIVSRPYINMTLSLMKDFGASARWATDDSIVVEPGSYRKRRYLVENDWSASSYWYEMLALSKESCEIVLPGLFEHSTQGDSAVSSLFARLGVDTVFLPDDGVRLTNGGTVAERFDQDFVNQPDLAQTFVVCCCMLGVPFHFTGLQSLKIKETDRISALRTELAKVGFDVHEANDSELFWNGERIAPVGQHADGTFQPFDTYEDHRMAMSLAPCAQRLGTIQMNDPHVVSKSYPRYWDDLMHMGFDIAPCD